MSKCVNPDLAKERHKNLDINALKTFIGVNRFNKPEEYEKKFKYS